MSKLKLFLLGGIFTLVGIFNISSAGSLTTTCSDETFSCSPNTFDLVSGELNYTCNITCAEENNYVEVRLFSQYSEFISSFQCNNNNSQLDQSGQQTIGDESGDPTNGQVVMNGQCNGTVNLGGTAISVGGSGGEGGEGGEGGQIIPGGFDNFTPAVNGLHETVKQLIPLVVYLGIGILVVILGFIAIRWLVNWMSNGIKSKFSSKRG